MDIIDNIINDKRIMERRMDKTITDRIFAI